MNYSERLIQLVREARLVENLGVALPTKIKEAVTSGQKHAPDPGPQTRCSLISFRSYICDLPRR